MPTEIVKYIDPDGGVLADYTSLQAAITAEKAIRSDLVARDEVLKLMCISSSGSPDITPVVINSGDFITDATRNIVVIGDGDYKLSVSSGMAFYVSTQYVDFYNFKFVAQNSYAFRGFQSKTKFINCILLRNSAGYVARFNLLGNAIFANTILYNTNVNTNTDYSFIFLQQSAAFFLTFYNCTLNAAENLGTGISTCFKNTDLIKRIRAKNTIVQNFDIAFSAESITDDSDYNISDDATAPGANSLNSTTVNFADAANGDFRLLTGSPGVDQGVDLSADPNYPFNTAIDGTLRPQGGAWDIGAFETTNAIELILQDINIPVNLSAGVISQAHQIIADDITIPVNLDAGIITQIHQIVADSLNIPVALDNGNLTQTHILTINDMLVAVGLDNMTIIGGSLVNGVAKLQLSITTPGVTPQITLPHIKMTMDN